MNKSLVWTERATKEFSDLFDYLYANWDFVVASRVRREMEHIIAQIQANPEHYPVYLKKKNVRRCVASPQTSIYFKIFDDKIEINAVFDNRQSPRKLKL
jgi:plasmid stabilization system protein ParE